MATVPPLPAARRSWKYLSPKDLRKFRNLLFAARIIVEGAYSGRHKSPYKGSAAEFIDYREYYPGDEIRTIDWKAYARTDRYFVKLFERETDMNCYLLVDRSGSMGYGGPTYKRFLPDPGVSKLEYACYLAAALSYLLVQQGDRVGLTLFDDTINTHVPPGGSFSHLYTILNALEQQRPGKTTSVGRVLRDAYGLYKRRGLLIVISDLLDDPESIFRALNMYRHRNFEVILFHVMHEYEIKLPPIESINFIDSETGDTLTSRAGDIRVAYDEEIKQFFHTMSSYARARNIDYNFVNTSTPYSEVLQKYLLRRGSL